MAVLEGPAPQKHAYVAQETWEVASLARRLVAWFVDLVLLMVVVFGVAAVLGLIETNQNVVVALDGSTTTLYRLPVQWSGALLALFSALYAIPLWRLTRATLGQRLLKLRVIDDGEPEALSWRQAAIRWLILFGWTFPIMGSAVAALTWVFTLVYVAWLVILVLSTWRHARGQGIHDRAARSLVEHRQQWTVVAPKTVADPSSRSARPVPVRPGAGRRPTRASRGPRRSTRGRPAVD